MDERGEKEKEEKVEPMDMGKKEEEEEESAAAAEEKESASFTSDDAGAATTEEKKAVNELGNVRGDIDSAAAAAAAAPASSAKDGGKSEREKESPDETTDDVDVSRGEAPQHNATKAEQRETLTTSRERERTGIRELELGAERERHSNDMTVSSYDEDGGVSAAAAAARMGGVATASGGESSPSAADTPMNLSPPPQQRSAGGSDNEDEAVNLKKNVNDDSSSTRGMTAKMRLKKQRLLLEAAAAAAAAAASSRDSREEDDAMQTDNHGNILASLPAATSISVVKTDNENGVSGGGSGGGQTWAVDNSALHRLAEAAEKKQVGLKKRLSFKKYIPKPPTEHATFFEVMPGCLMLTALFPSSLFPTYLGIFFVLSLCWGKLIFCSLPKVELRACVTRKDQDKKGWTFFL